MTVLSEELHEAAKKHTKPVHFMFPGEDDFDWRVDIDYCGGKCSDNPWFTFHHGGVWSGVGQLGFRKGGVGRVHGPSHPSIAVYGPYIRPDPRLQKGEFRVPEGVQAYAIRWAAKRGLVHAPEGSFEHPRGRGKRGPTVSMPRLR